MPTPPRKEAAVQEWDLLPELRTWLGTEEKEELPVISPEKQALVDIFLAEEVLQVAYEMHEQTEPLRAYIATLEGRELETSHQIISF